MKFKFKFKDHFLAPTEAVTVPPEAPEEDLHIGTDQSVQRVPHEEEAGGQRLLKAMQKPLVT